MTLSKAHLLTSLEMSSRCLGFFFPFWNVGQKKALRLNNSDTQDDLLFLQKHTRVCAFRRAQSGREPLK